MGKRAVTKKAAKLEAKAALTSETKVVLNTIRISPIKLNLVAQMIRGMNIERKTPWAVAVLGALPTWVS